MNSVLIHEQDRGLRKALTIVLIDYFVETRIAQDVDQFLQLLKKYSPQLIILDYEDKALTRETIHVISKMNSECKIIITYFEMDETEHNELLKVGVNCFLEKPYNLDLLTKFLDKLKGGQ